MSDTPDSVAEAHDAEAHMLRMLFETIPECGVFVDANLFISKRRANAALDAILARAFSSPTPEPTDACPTWRETTDEQVQPCSTQTAYFQVRYYCDKCGKELDAFAGNILPLKGDTPTPAPEPDVEAALKRIAASCKRCGGKGYREMDEVFMGGQPPRRIPCICQHDAEVLRTALEAKDGRIEELTADIGYYHGNSIQHWYAKAKAHGAAIMRVWQVLADAGYPADGKTDVAERARQALTLVSEQRDRLRETGIGYLLHPRSIEHARALKAAIEEAQ